MGPDRGDDVAANEASEETRLRAAYARRGPLEAHLAGNAGQAALVAERDARVLAALARQERPVRDILDLGCGEGATLAWLVDHAGIRRAVGVDVLPERIAGARTAWPALEFHVADGRSLPFPDESFDAVIALTVFSSVLADARAGMLHEVARVLRPGGAFIWYDMRRRSPRNPDVRPFTARDVRAALTGWTVDATPITVAPPLARRLGPATRVMYPILAHVHPLLTHEVGVAVRPGGRASSPPGA
jgi:ubiquinone/menaquinone biosynthesis C-methylase UbiE